MSDRRTDEDLLLRYFDGDLPAGEARGVEERVAADASAREQLEGLAELQGVVRAHYDAEADDADGRLADLWRNISAGMERPKPSLLGAVRAWLGSWKGYTLAGLAGAAAGALLVLGFLPAKIVVAPVVLPAAQNDVAQDAEVESLEVAGGTGTVFHIPGGANEAATTVIWVTPDIPTPDSEDPI